MSHANTTAGVPEVIRASIIGASGYAGGELLRLLGGHPRVRVVQATSRSNAGAPVQSVHPHLRLPRSRLGDGLPLQFTAPPGEGGGTFEACDVMFLCQPHGVAATKIEQYAQAAPRIIDLSADFRLRDAAAYRQWYDQAHPAPAWLDRFVYGLAELERTRLRGARYASGVGCNATAMNLALLPLARQGWIERAICDIKVGSSEAGSEPSPSSHHAARTGVVRTFSPTRHRHEGEVRQQLMQERAFELHSTITSVELVRGVLCTAHVLLNRDVTEKDVWQAFRGAYGEEPFVRIVKDKTGQHRHPEPKILAGTNWCDVGFEVEPGARRVVAFAALDNLMKGAAGSAVQCMNLMFGLDETMGLEFGGLYPL
ncbi:MAG: N-acetyl-gamma-glutamyl-phosphate reductase [Planctomycetota bacterium]|nr:N-acetyl-gamma-glutamyl-phosphate reductase [Planctomycetota bacterium]